MSTKPLVDVFVIEAMFDPFVTVNVCVDPFDSVTVYVSTTPDVDVLTMLVMPVPVFPACPFHKYHVYCAELLGAVELVPV